MDPVVKRLWAAALRSERYPQGIGALHTLPHVIEGEHGQKTGETAEGFCCLGVLCEVAMDHGLELTRETGGLADLIASHGFYNGYGQYLPPQVAKWAGLYDAPNEESVGCNPSVVVDEEFIATYTDRFGIAPPWSEGEVTELAELNDSPIQFDLIAGLIERSL